MNGEGFRFRALNLADKSDVLAISAKIWDGDDYVPSSFDSWISDRGGVLNGCFLGDKLVGFGRVGFVAPGHAWLEGLRKDPDAGVKGVGRALCLEGLRFLSGIPDLRSVRFTAYAHNPETIALNEGLGFKRIATLSIKSRRLSASDGGEESRSRMTAGVPGEERRTHACRRIQAGVDDRAIASRLASAGWFKDFRIESWKAYPCETSRKLRPDDLLFESISPDGELKGCLVGSVDPLKRQANVVAFDAEDAHSAKALFAEFEKAVLAAGYGYIEAVAGNDRSLLSILDACGYASWETENDFLIYELPLDTLKALCRAQPDGSC